MLVFESDVELIDRLIDLTLFSFSRIFYSYARTQRFGEQLGLC